MEERKKHKKILKNKMIIKKIILLIFLINITTNTTALNDVNVSIDSGSVQLCLAEKTLTNMTCNTTTVLTLTGESDHFLYFTSDKLYETFDRNTDDKWQWVSDQFFTLIDLVIDIMYFFTPFFIYLGGGLIAIYIIIRFIMSHT